MPQRESVDWDFPVTVRDVVLMGTYGRLGWFRRPGRAEREIADRCLDQVGMSDFADRQIRQLSGGQQQRVFLARALAQEARVYFMDEPFSGVDAATEAAIIELLQNLRSGRQDGVRRASRSADRAQLLRLRDPAQHAARRLRADAKPRSLPRTCTRPTAAG